MAANDVPEVLAAWRRAEQARGQHPFGSAQHDIASRAAQRFRTLYHNAVAGVADVSSASDTAQSHRPAARRQTPLQ